MDPEMSDDVHAEAHATDVEMSVDVGSEILNTKVDRSHDEMDSVTSSFHPDNGNLENSVLDTDTRSDGSVIAGSQVDNASVLGHDSIASLQGNTALNTDNENCSDIARDGDEPSDGVSSHSKDIIDRVTARSHEPSCGDVQFTDSKMNDCSDVSLDETSSDKVNKTSNDKLTEQINDKVKDISDDGMDEPSNDKLADSSHDKVNNEPLNDKMTDLCGDRVNETLTGKVNKETLGTKPLVLDDKTGQLVVSENKKSNDVVIIDDEADDEAGKIGHRHPQTPKDHKVNGQTTNSLNKTGQVMSVSNVSDIQTSTATVGSGATTMTGPDKTASVSTDSKGHMMLHVPVEKQQQLLLGGHQIIGDLVPVQQQHPPVAQPTVQQLINRTRNSKQSDPAPGMPGTETKKLTVWAQSLVDIGFDLVKSTVLQDFISLQNKKLDAGELPDAAKTQLEKFKKNHEELRNVTEHLSVRMSRRCKLCRFRTESSNVMHWHKQHPHTDPRSIVSCSYCTFTTRNLAAFNFHMQTDHMGQAFFERELQKYECSLCHFEGSSKTKFQKHRSSCERSFQLFTNLCPTSSHVTYCLHDGMYMKPPVPNIVSYAATHPQRTANRFYNANAPTTTRYKFVNPPNVSMSSMQNQFTVRPSSSASVRQVTSLLNKPVQQSLVRPQMFPVQSAAVNSMFTRAPAVSSGPQQQGVSPIILSQLSANPSLITRFVTGPNSTQYNLQIQQQLAQLQQLQVQNAQAMQMLKQQKPQVKTMQPILYNQASSVVTRASTPNIINRPSSIAGINRMTNQSTTSIQSTPQTSVTSAKVWSTLNVMKSNESVPATNSVKLTLNEKSAATTSNSLITCEVCQGFVKDRNALRVHLFYAHQVKIPDKMFNANNPPFWCGACQSRFWSGQGMVEHKSKCKLSATTVTTPRVTPIQTVATSTAIQQNKNVDTYTCIICYRPVTMLLNHMKSMHDLALADFMLARKCVACGLVFNTNELLNTHMSALHGFTVKKPTLKSPLALAREQNRPSVTSAPSVNVQRQPPSADATKWPSITSSSAQQQQTPKQQPVRGGVAASSMLPESQSEASYKCVICKINFDSNASLTRHCLTFHTNCKYCGMIFPNVNTMRNHMCISDPRYRKCEICKSSMKNKSYQRHIETKHLKKCCVTLKRLSEEQIEDYRRVKHRKLNTVPDIPAEEVGSTALHQNGFYQNTNTSKDNLDDSAIVVIDDTAPSPSNKSPRKLPIRPMAALEKMKSRFDSSADSSVVMNGDVVQ